MKVSIEKVDISEKPFLFHEGKTLLSYKNSGMVKSYGWKTEKGALHILDIGSYITCVTDLLQRNAMRHHLNDASKVRTFWTAEIKLFKSHSLGPLWKCRFHNEKFRWTWTFCAAGCSSPNLYWKHAHFWVFVIAIKTTKPCRSGHRNRENGSRLPLDSHRSKGFHRSGPQWRQDPVWPSLS